MTREETINKLTEMFIEKYGEQEVMLSKQILLGDVYIGMFDTTTEYLRSIRRKNGNFQMEIVNDWSGEWREDMEKFNMVAMEVLSDCLGVTVKVKVEYSIYSEKN